MTDDIDEQPLTVDEIHELCTLFFVGDDGCIKLPHPKKDGWENFVRALKIMVDKEELQWNPVKKRNMPWINFDKLESIHGRHHRGHRHRGDPHRPSRPSGQSKQRRNTHHTGDRERHQPEGRARRATAHARAQEPRRASEQSRDPPEAKSAPRAQHRPSDYSDAGSTASGKDLTLTEVLARWSHKPPTYDQFHHSLQHLLVTVPDLFPPTNAAVEDHDYFKKWKTFDEEAFADVDGDELKELLKRGALLLLPSAQSFLLFATLMLCLVQL